MEDQPAGSGSVLMKGWREAVAKRECYDGRYVRSDDARMKKRGRLCTQELGNQLVMNRYSDREGSETLEEVRL